MDGSRFDALTRVFARPASRRRTLAGAVAAALAPLAVAARPGQGPEPAKCLAQGKRCRLQDARHGHGQHSGKGKHHPPSCSNCCSRYGAAGADGKARCTCKSEGIACDGDAQCCSGQCRDGTCTACPPGTVFCPDGCANLQTDPKHCGACDTACASGQRCQGGTCVCDGTSCSFGCCANDGSCQRGTSDQACGDNGAACADCAQTGQVCRQQACCASQCAGKRCGDSDGCGGTCDGPCPNECQTCDGGVCQNKDDGIPCGGEGSGLRCCHGQCPPPPTCLPPGTCCDQATTCLQCCAKFGAEAGCAETFGYVCEASGPGESCVSDADCGGSICRCGTCCIVSGDTSLFCPGDGRACCSGACDGDFCA